MAREPQADDVRINSSMTTNPFDDDSGTFYAPVNHEGTRSSCPEHIERQRTDLRPQSLTRRMERDARAPAPR